MFSNILSTIHKLCLVEWKKRGWKMRKWRNRRKIDFTLFGLRDNEEERKWGGWSFLTQPTNFFFLPNWEEKSKENVNEKKSAKLPQSFHNSTFNNNGIRVADFIFLVFHHFYQSAKSAIYHFSRKLLATYHLLRGVWKCTFFWKTKTKSMYHTYIFIVE